MYGVLVSPICFIYSLRHLGHKFVRHLRGIVWMKVEDI